MVKTCARRVGIMAMACALLLTPTMALSGSALCSWTPPVHPGPLLYTVYYGTASRQYTTAVDAGSATSVSIGGLTPGLTYFFAATATDDQGRESVYSAEGSKLIPPDNPGGDVTPPTVAITSPAHGSTVPRRGQVTITAEGQDDVGVTQIDIFVMRNGNVVHSCGNSLVPFTCAWTVPAANGALYRLVAQARDAAGHVGESPIVEVTAQ